MRSWWPHQTGGGGEWITRKGRDNLMDSHNKQKKKYYFICVWNCQLESAHIFFRSLLYLQQLSEEEKPQDLLRHTEMRFPKNITKVTNVLPCVPGGQGHNQDTSKSEHDAKMKSKQNPRLSKAKHKGLRHTYGFHLELKGLDLNELQSTYAVS